MTNEKYTPSFETLKQYAIHELDDNRLTHSATRTYLLSEFNVSNEDIEKVFEEIS
jgi:hypothetical protein